MATPAAVAMPWKSHKNKMVLFLNPVLHVHGVRVPLATISNALKVEQWHGIDNAITDIRADKITLCQQGRLREALDVLYFMDHHSLHPDTSTFTSLLQACVDNKALTEGKLVHAHIIHTGFKPNIYLENTLVVMYAKCGSLIDARGVLDQMQARNVVSWTAMIAAYTSHGLSEEALTLFYKMQRTGMQPNPFTLSSVLPSCANLAALEHGKEVHKEIIRSGFQSNLFLASALVDMYVKSGSVENARNVFDKMPERNVVSWNAMIAGYAQNGCIDKALDLFEKMPERTVVSWTAMIAGYAQNGRVDEALILFQNIPEQDVVSWTTIIAGCAQNGRIDEAFELFQKMPGKNVVSWTAMIAGFVQNEHFDEALKLFQRMQLTDVKPNADTFTSVLPACANLAALENGKTVHEDIIRRGSQFDVFVGNALVDMYAKCGRIDDACRVFDKMPKRSVISWTAMIVGYGMHGYGKEALKIFEQMQHSDMIPNHVTFLGVLSACCHAGLVDDGWHYFHCMTQYYHITPTMKHYCCMVDLLGRAGRLDEAQDFINKMPIKPDADVWVSLLGACRIHADIKLGECVAEWLFELDPRNAAPYVLLSNIYAAAGRWNDIEKVRNMMKDRKVKQKPGCSWIEVNKQVHAFLVGDRSHPQAEEIYKKLERLSGQMKEAGYVPNTRFVLHDVEEEQKEHILCHHSEKLAIAFGLINTSPRTPIRIVKSLRTCGDCHSATKFISKIVEREIVVRDANRFHHFKDGQCSCRDFW
eukprot:Gb_25048 [translate_table: standard]